MAGFGEGLRRERQMRRISLEEISETTKISVRFLEALENEEFSKLPGGIFVRSFIRSYANYLGLDADGVLAEYAFIAPPPEAEDFSKLCASTGGLGQSKKRMAIVPWVLAVILLGGGYAIFRYAHRVSDAPLVLARSAPDSNAGMLRSGDSHAVPAQGGPQVIAPTRAPQPLASSATQAPDLPRGKSGPQASGTEPASSSVASASAASADDVPGASRNDPSSNSRLRLIADPAHDGSPPNSLNSRSLAAAKAHGELVLQVAANQPSWVAVEADGKTVFEHVLAADNVRTLIAKNSFDVTTGNAQGTVLTLNGVILKPLGRHGEVRRLHLTRSDLKRFTP
jgi:cytoskeleton protein RodZ